jgi:predicted Zn-dependent protease
MAARRIRLTPILAGLVALGACVQDDGSRFNPLDVVVPSYNEDAEREMGMEFDRQLQQAVEVIHDPVVAGFMNDLGQEMVRQVEPQPFIYRFRVIKDPSLNAFAVPGGYIYFHSGTLLKVGSIDELAGVLGHEIAHVKAHHHFRMQQKAQLPDLLAAVASIAVMVASGEPELVALAQAINVAVQLSFSREFEAEADQLGGIFAARGGYEPGAITSFFERILAENRLDPNQIPPYLFTHPEVEDRIATVTSAAETLRPTRDPDPALAEALHEVQARLGLLIDTKRSSLPSYAPPADRAKTDPLLAEAKRLAEEGEANAALVQLARAEAVEPNDPRVPFRIGEILYQAERYPEAAAAYRRTVRLDPSRARVFYQLGLAYKAIGERHRAVFALEQALLRVGDSSALRRLAEWEVEKLTFAVVPEAGFADGSSARGADTPAGFSREAFRQGDPEMRWWARLGTHFADYVDKIEVHWIDPTGRLVQKKPAERLRGPYIGSRLEFGASGAGPAGSWRVEVHLEGDVIDSRSVEVQAQPG